MNRYNDVIGLLGGMGSYSTLHFYKRLLDSLPATEEYDRPRIIIDNYCTLPNKIRAYLYGIEKETLITNMSSSLTKMISMGCNKTLIICYSAHVFINDICKAVPELKNYFVDILECLMDKLNEKGITEAIVLTTDNTAKIGVFDIYFRKRGVDLIYDLDNNRDYITPLMTAGEQYIVNEDIKKLYYKLIEMYNSDKTIILGCTELSYINYICGLDHQFSNVIDPLECALESIILNLT